MIRTAERVSSQYPADNFVFQRSLFAYQQAAELISGNVLEIGTGTGYGVSTIAPKATEFWTIDKHPVYIDYNTHTNTRFICKEVPWMEGIPDAYFDYVISFQVIEHIDNDTLFLSEIRRVLKPGGSLIISTPNARRSLTRNPWHIREYSFREFRMLLSGQNFEVSESLGVYGTPKVESYYLKNKQSVEKILRFDLISLNRLLPAYLLRIPYHLANQINRNYLLKNNRKMIDSICLKDYYFQEASDDCFDLFYVATSV